MRTPEDNYRSEELSAMASCAKRLEDELIKLNEGRNLKCWPLCSFGWKDADLDAEGCTGISKITNMDDDSVTVKVGGHKTFCDPAEEVEDDDQRAGYTELAHELVCSAAGSGEWTGDDWSWGFVEEVTVEWADVDDGTDFTKTAERIIDKAKEVCEPYEKSWAEVSKAITELYKQIEKETNGAC